MDELLVERSGKVVTVILDRPPANALTLALYRRIAEVFREIGTGGANCVVLTARGDTFCTGVDLNELSGLAAEDDPKRSATVREMYRTVRACAVPVIAAVNGAALGAGTMLAAVADIRIASDAASFGMNEIDIGRCGGGGIVGRLIPPGAMRLLYFTGQPVSAAEAHRLGLVDRLVSAVELLPAAYHLAEVIASKSPIGLRMAKEALNQVEALPVEEGYELEQQYSTQLMHTQDAHEALRATVAGRPPRFKGR